MANRINDLKERYDVLIVGSGPAGAGTARALTGSGLQTLVIERALLPRDKICSGIIFPSARKIIADTFGELPEKVFCNPKEIPGNRMFMTNDSEMMEMPWSAIDPGVGLPRCGLNIYRSELDYWLCEQSDASLIDACLFVDFRLEADDIVVEVRHEGKYKKIKTGYLVGADGLRSKVRRSVSPEFEKTISWLPVYEEWYQGTGNLEPGFLYFFLDREITDTFATVFHKDELIHVTTTVNQGKSSKRHLYKLRDLLIKKHGLVIENIIKTTGIIKNDMTAMKNYFFGKGNILITGEANGIIESINSALMMGKAAGESILESINTGKPAYGCFIENPSLQYERERGEKIQEGLEANAGFNS